MFDKDAGLLSMLVEQTAESRKAYERIVERKSQDLASQMCWTVDWYPERLPLENATGTSMNFYLQAMADPLSTIGQFPPPVDQLLPEKEDVLVFADGYGYCKEIMQQAPPGRIGIANMQTKAASRYNERDVKGLVNMREWDLIIFALGIDPPASNKVADVHQQQGAVIQVYLHILKTLSDDSSRCKRLCILTVDTFAEEREIHEECGLGLITNCTLFGMTNTARFEVQCPIQYIDTEWALRTENTKYLCAEIFRQSSFGQNSVRILNSGRYVLRQVPAGAFENGLDFRLPERGTVAISGGNGAIGLVMGLWLLRQAKAQGCTGFSIDFLSRSARISDQNMPNWQEIEQLANELGMTVSQTKCDVSQQQGVDNYIRDISPNLAGFIHSAGILQDAILMNQTWEKFEAVFEAKSRAALFLHDALERHSNPGFEFFWMFSSTAVYGNMGQLNYSASNSFLDGLARHRRALGKVATVSQWGAWGEVGMAANLDEASKRRFANSPQPPFSNAEALRGLEAGLRTNLAYFGVFKYNLPLIFSGLQHNIDNISPYMINFTSDIAPPPPGDPTKNAYLTVSYETRKETHSTGKGLVFQHHWPRLAQQIIDDE